jgi:hypothetical protein
MVLLLALRIPKMLHTFNGIYLEALARAALWPKGPWLPLLADMSSLRFALLGLSQESGDLTV